MLSLVREFSLSSVVCFFYFVENGSECSVLHLHDIKSYRYFLRATVQMWEYTFGLGLKDEGKIFSFSYWCLRGFNVRRSISSLTWPSDVRLRLWVNDEFNKLSYFSYFSTKSFYFFVCRSKMECFKLHLTKIFCPKIKQKIKPLERRLYLNRHIL